MLGFHSLFRDLDYMFSIHQNSQRTLTLLEYIDRYSPDRDALYRIINSLVNYIEKLHDQGLWISNFGKNVVIESGDLTVKTEAIVKRGTNENLSHLLQIVYRYLDIPYSKRGSAFARSRMSVRDNDEILNLEKRIADRNKQDNTPNKGIQCDECGEAPIIGVRWKCKTCSSSFKSFDLCERCYGTSIHKNQHNCEKIIPPDQVENRPTFGFHNFELMQRTLNLRRSYGDDSANSSDDENTDDSNDDDEKTDDSENENEKETSPSGVVNINSFNESRKNIEQTPIPSKPFSFKFKTLDDELDLSAHNIVRVACGLPPTEDEDDDDQCTPIGSSNATVFKVKLGNKNNIAVKLITSKQLEDEKKAMKEASKTFSHENIVSIYDSMNVTLFGEKNMLIAMECGLFDCDKLGAKLITARGSGTILFGELICWQILKQVVSALQYMHEDGKHIHRDIKPHNILVKEYNFKNVPNAYIKTLLCDFGLTRSENTITMSGKGAGTEGFIAPELKLDTAEPSRESDIYALGVSISRLEHRIPNHTKIIQLLQKMKSTDPKDRPSHEYILGQSMFNAILTVAIGNQPLGSVVPILNKRCDQLNYNNEWHDLNKFIFPSCSVKFISHYAIDFVQDFRKKYVAYSDTEQFEVIDVEMDHVITSKGVIYWKLVEVVG